MNMVNKDREQDQQPQPVNKKGRFSFIKGLVKRRLEPGVSSEPKPLPFWEEFDKRKLEEYEAKKVSTHRYISGSTIEDDFKKLPDRSFSTEQLVIDLNKPRRSHKEEGFYPPIKYMVEHSTLEEVVNVFNTVFSKTPERELTLEDGLYGRPDICVRTLDLILKRLVVQEERTALKDTEKDSVDKLFQILQKVFAKMANDFSHQKISHSYEIYYGTNVTALFGNHYGILFGLGGRFVEAGIEAVQEQEEGVSNLMNACEYLSPDQSMIALTALLRPAPTSPMGFELDYVYRADLWYYGIRALGESFDNCPEELKEQYREKIIFFLRTMKILMKQIGTHASSYNFALAHPEFEKALLDYRDPEAEVISSLQEKNPLTDRMVRKLEGFKYRKGQNN